MNELVPHIGASIRHHREKAGLRQEDLCEALEVTRPQVANIEAGRSDVPASRLPELAHVLGVSIDELFSLKVCPTCDGRGWVHE